MLSIFYYFYFKKFFKDSQSDVDTLLKYANEILDNYNKSNDIQKLDYYDNIDPDIILQNKTAEK